MGRMSVAVVLDAVIVESGGCGYAAASNLVARDPRASLGPWMFSMTGDPMSRAAHWGQVSHCGSSSRFVAPSVSVCPSGVVSGSVCVSVSPSRGDAKVCGGRDAVGRKALWIRHLRLTDRIPQKTQLRLPFAAMSCRVLPCASAGIFAHKRDGRVVLSQHCIFDWRRPQIHPPRDIRPIASSCRHPVIRVEASHHRSGSPLSAS